MGFLEKLAKRNADPFGSGPVTVVFLGDSVTQGCFEIYFKDDGELETVYETERSYASEFRKLVNMLWPRATINVINSGISGDRAEGGLKRLERDVLSYRPDLTVVSLGLNNLSGGEEGLEAYGETLRSIFDRLAKAGSEAVFHWPCMMADRVSELITDPKMREVAARFAVYQQNGMIEKYHDKALAVAAECGVRFCDGYAFWKKLHDNGVDTTFLLANGINHPVREMHKLMAVRLLETILDR